MVILLLLLDLHFDWILNFVPVVQLGDTCATTADCADDNAACDSTSSTCQCPDGFYVDDNGECQPRTSNSLILYSIPDIILQSHVRYYLRCNIVSVDSVIIMDANTHWIINLCLVYKCCICNVRL